MTVPKMWPTSWRAIAGPMEAILGKDGPMSMPSRARKVTIPTLISRSPTARVAPESGRSRWAPMMLPSSTAQMIGKSTMAAGPTWNL